MASNRLRVLWVTNMFPDPGTAGFRGIFVGQQAEALRALDAADVDVVLVAQGRGSADYLLANPRVRRRWKSGGFDLVHVHYGLTGLATLLLPPGVPRVFTFYGSDMNLALPRALARIVARGARRRIFVSRRLADRWPSDRNIVCPNGIDFDRCRPAPRAEACRRLGLDPSRKWVLFGAYPSNPVKGFDRFRAVLDTVRARVPEAETLVLSETGQPYARVIEKLNAADVLLFTSRRGQEGSPTVVKEALAVGLPVVSVDVGDVREMLAGVEPGGVVDWPRGGDGEPALIEELARAVLSVLAADRRADGRERRDSLRREHVARRTLDIYREVLEEGG